MNTYITGAIIRKLREEKGMTQLQLAEATGAFPVQCIGNKFVLYRESKNNKSIIIPKI